MDNFTVVIPARYASTRFPGKALVDLCGLPMIVRTWQCVNQDVPAARIIVATDDVRIDLACRKHGIKNVEMTSEDCRTGTDRAAEVAARHPDVKLWVVVLGDTPLLPSGIIQPIVDALEFRIAATIGRCRLAPESVGDPTVHKLILTARGDYLYGSRNPIPHGKGEFWEQVNVCAMCPDALRRFAELEMGPIERRETLEIMRLIEHNHRVQTVEVASAGPHVDTPEDADRVRRVLERTL